MNKIPFNKPNPVGDELANIADALARGHLSGDGFYTKRCHQWLEQRLQCKRALLTHSCTGALDMAAILCDLKPGDEVIMPSYTFVSTANAFAMRGAVPVFVDVRADTINIDERLIEAAITPKTRAIAVVHYAGLACDMDAIMAIAAREGLFAVDDLPSVAHRLRQSQTGQSRPTTNVQRMHACARIEQLNYLFALTHHVGREVNALKSFGACHIELRQGAVVVAHVSRSK